MGRKEGSSFKALIDYIMRDDACDQNHILHHNLLGRTRDEVVAELEQNARCLKKRKNGNAAYHEVVSIRCVPGMDREEQKRKLVEIAERYVRMLAGWRVKAVPPSGSKETRAGGFASQAEAGNVLMVKAHWNQAFIDEMATFPLGTHDDQVDAASDAFNALLGPQKAAVRDW